MANRQADHNYPPLAKSCIFSCPTSSLMRSKWLMGKAKLQDSRLDLAWLKKLGKAIKCDMDILSPISDCAQWKTCEPSCLPVEVAGIIIAKTGGIKNLFGIGITGQCCPGPND